MRATRWTAVAAAAAAAGMLARCAPTTSDLPPEQAEAFVRQATFLLVPPRCGGAVVNDPHHGLTAAHCVDAEGEPLTVALASGARVEGVVTVVDRPHDLALIAFDSPAPAIPLEVAREAPREGDALLFAGRIDQRGTPAQHVWLRKLGRCPSLPEVPDALFTTVEGHKGDSGSPIVDRDLRVVGLVHGGAACNIAAPARGALALMEEDAQPRQARRRLPVRPVVPAAVLRAR